MRGFIVAALVLLSVQNRASAERDCKTDKGAYVNPDNGSYTEKLTGTVTCIYDGERITETRYQNGKEVSEDWYYRKGKRQRSEKYVYTANGNRRNQGKVQEWYENGQLKSFDTYDKGDQHGPFARYYENGSVRHEGHYARGREIASRTLNTDGSLDYLTCTEDPAVAKLKDFRDWCGFAGKPYANTYFYEKDKKSLILTFEKGKVVASQKYNTDGVLVESDDRARGKQTGVKVSRHDNGKTKQETRYNDGGRLHGLQREFDESGPLTREATFENGEMTEEKLYFFNGQLKRHTRRTPSTEGKAQVTMRCYYDDGKLECTASFLETEKSIYFGYGEFWNYQLLEPYGEHKWYRPNGTLSSVNRYQNGNRHGLSVEYHKDGKTHAIEDQYEEDHLRRRKKYDAAGKLTYDEEFFKDGSRKRHAVKR